MTRTEALDTTHALIAPGQGNQKIGMGLELAQISPAAEAIWRKSDKALAPQLGYNLSDLVWYGRLDSVQLGPEQAQAEITKTANAQPAIIADALARTDALEEAGVLGAPGWHAGNSVALIVALRNAGSLSIDGAVRLAEGRGEAFRYVISNRPRTTMVALVNIDPQLIKELKEKYGLAVCLRNPGQIVMGGEVENEEGKDMKSALAYLEGELGEEDFKDHVAPLQVDAAYHSKYIAAAVPFYQAVVGGVEITAPTNGRLVGGSTVRELLTPEDIRRELVLQLTQTEDWNGVVHFLRGQGVTTMTELNDSPRLTAMNRRTFRGVTYKVSLANGEDKSLTVAYRWTAPEAVRIAGGSDGISREDVRDFYLEWLANRSDRLIEELSESMHFVDDVNLDSEDLKALRAAVRKRFGRNVPDEEAEKNVTVDSAIDSTYKLISSQ